MRKLIGRIVLAVTCLSLALPAVASAGSAQASLSIGVVVPARCAVRVGGGLRSGEPTANARDAVVMKCTKGTLPSEDRASASRAGAAEPRVTQHLVMGTSAIASAPQPLTEQGFAAATDGAAVPRLIVTVNF